LLVVYFVLAIGAHARIKDRPARYVPAVAMLGWSALAARCFSSPPMHGSKAMSDDTASADAAA
jgi:hypothetical protein